MASAVAAHARLHAAVAVRRQADARHAAHARGHPGDGAYFKNGTLAQEVVQTCASADMVVLAVIEHTHVEVGGLPTQEWALRVTLVYRREGAQWRPAHRHADPLALGSSLDQAAALARPPR